METFNEMTPRLFAGPPTVPLPFPPTGIMMGQGFPTSDASEAFFPPPH